MGCYGETDVRGGTKKTEKLTRGGVIMPKLKKDTRIKREFKRLEMFYEDLEENKLKFITPLIQNLAFMKVTLEDLQEVINKNGCYDEYKNGANQYGKKASAEIQSYNSLIKNYNNISERLEKMLPERKKKSKLEMLRDE